MIKCFLSFLIFLIPLSASAYSLITKVVDGHRVRIFHIPYDGMYRVRAVASSTGATLQNLIKNNRGVAGINGAYFVPGDYMGKPNQTSAIRIINGIGFIYSQFYPDTGIGGIFGFLSDNTPVLVQNNMYGNKGLKDNYNADLLGYIQSGISNFPILLAGGISIILEYSNLGLITEKMKNIGTNSFICRTEGGDVKMGTIEKISMLDVPDFILRFGCVDAINLDAGGSLAMYNKGKYVIGSSNRNVMDAFIIVRKY